MLAGAGSGLEALGAVHRVVAVREAREAAEAQAEVGAAVEAEEEQVFRLRTMFFWWCLRTMAFRRSCEAPRCRT